MVKILLFILSATTMASFRMECGRDSFYEGESVDCQFSLYTTAPAVEVEVQKFPEFRGFWSENLQLRQGVLSAGQLFQNLQLLKPHASSAIGIGTYLITPMLKAKEYQILPMKVVLKGQGVTEDQILESTKKAMRVIPLPAIPRALAQHPFSGLVGLARLHVHTHEIKFENDQVASLNYSIEGSGNFQELSALKLDWPPGVEVATERSMLSGNALMGSKRFDVSLTVHANHNLEIPRKDFLLFNPTKRQFERLTFPSVELVYVPSHKATHNLPSEEKLERPSVWIELFLRLKDLPWLWIVGTVALFALGVSVIGILRNRLKTPKRPKIQKPKRPLLEGTDLPSLMRSAYDIALFDLLDRTGLPPSSSRRTAMELAENTLSPELVTNYDKIFTAYDLLFFSPERTETLTEPLLRKSVQTIQKAS